MGIFDIFNFKTKFAEAFSQENITLVRGLIREKIVEQIKANIPGEEKMQNVIEAVMSFVKEHIHSSNAIVQWCIDTFLIGGLREMAQSIYENLKERVRGL